MECIRVELGERSYPVHVEEGCLNRAGGLLREALDPCALAVVTDDGVPPLFLQRVKASCQEAGYRVCPIVLPHGESTKSMAGLERLFGFFSECGITRYDAVAALGGGVIGDLAGFAAATWLRGLRFVQIPTTLLAQVDSSVGGKVAVNLPQGKNLVGAFHQPQLVLCDPLALETLPPEIWRDGLGEVVKYGCIRDPELFCLLENCASGGRPALMGRMDTILRHCIQAKAGNVAMDELDLGLRATLNFGHTLAHAIEACQGYQGSRHGEAVAIGMSVLARLSERRGMTEAGTSARLDALLSALGLSCSLPPDLDEETLIRAMRLDKKNHGDTLRLILLRRIGECYQYDTTPDFFSGMRCI